MDVFELRQRVIDDYRRYITSFISIRDQRIQAEVDAIRDLRPVCPNCHAMLHRRRPAYTIAERRRLLRT